MKSVTKAAVAALGLMAGADARKLNAEYQNDLSGVINTYAYVTDADVQRATNILNVDNAEDFARGDYVLLHQTQGEATAGGEHGQYDVNVIRGIVGNTITLDTGVNANFVSGKANDGGNCEAAVTQLVKIPIYAGDAIVTGTLEPKKWDGQTGGILAAYVEGKLTVGRDGILSASGMGFRGGSGGGEGVHGHCAAEGGGGNEGNAGSHITDGYGGTPAISSIEMAHHGILNFGGAGGSDGGDGGGLVFLKAATVRHRGVLSQLTADGHAGSDANGGGAGGSIRIEMEQDLTIGRAALMSAYGTHGGGDGLSITAALTTECSMKTTRDECKQFPMCHWDHACFESASPPPAPAMPVAPVLSANLEAQCSEYNTWRKDGRKDDLTRFVANGANQYCRANPRCHWDTKTKECSVAPIEPPEEPEPEEPEVPDVCAPHSRRVCQDEEAFACEWNADHRICHSIDPCTRFSADVCEAEYPDLCSWQNLRWINQRTTPGVSHGCVSISSFEEEDK